MSVNDADPLLEDLMEDWRIADELQVILAKIEYAGGVTYAESVVHLWAAINRLNASKPPREPSNCGNLQDHRAHCIPGSTGEFTDSDAFMCDGVSAKE